jgi:hypothetical protein
MGSPQWKQAGEAAGSVSGEDDKVTTFGRGDDAAGRL